MKSILLTGCNGLIGKAVAKELQRTGHHTLYGLSPSGGPVDHWLPVNLEDPWSTDLLPEKIDVVLHFAQSRHFRDFPNSAEKIFRVNTESTLKLLEYARKAGAKKFIYASSGGIYGNSNDEFTEDSAVSMRNDLGFYLSTKFCSELLVQSYAPFFNIDILRFFFVFGENQKKDMLIPRLVDSVYNGTPIQLQGEGGLKLNPVHVNDAAKAIVACLKLSGNNRINIAGSEVLCLREICEIIGRHLGIKPVFEVKEGEPAHLVADITRMKALLHVPQISFEQGVSYLTKRYE